MQYFFVRRPFQSIVAGEIEQSRADGFVVGRRIRDAPMKILNLSRFFVGDYREPLCRSGIVAFLVGTLAFHGKLLLKLLYGAENGIAIVHRWKDSMLWTQI